MNDLISREALKKHKLTVQQANGVEIEDIDVVPLACIDNAPTVNFMISPDYVTELQNRNKELTKQLEEAERPQNKWIITDIGFARCPFCNCERQYPENYCGYCGADLRSEDNV